VSGVFALANLDGRPVEAVDMQRMAHFLERRGPERTGVWREGSVGLGHTLLTTTPEERFQSQPIAHAHTGVVITGDVRIDNRDEVLRALGASDRDDSLSDTGVVLAAYLRWGDACVDHLLGDFAFALWDGRQRRLFCARDRMGMRTLYYHHTLGRLVAVATSAKAVVVLPQVLYRINEGRIADFLVEPLEGIDYTSTFYEDVFRLPPAHTLTIDESGLRLRKYWAPEPHPERGLKTDADYREAFLDVFTEAVRCRLRSDGRIGSMMSGGVDSTSVAAVARRILAADGRGPLRTYSGVSPNADDIETRHVHFAMGMDGVDPQTISFGELDCLQPDLSTLMSEIDEPFDMHMSMIQAIYLSAHRDGINVVLDGVSADSTLSHRGYLARLIRSGSLIKARREIVGSNAFWGSAVSPTRVLSRVAAATLIPSPARRVARAIIPRRRVGPCEPQVVNPEFARRIDLDARRATLAAARQRRATSDRFGERVDVALHPFVTVARERYDRVAAAVGIEPRDPFLDERVLKFCLDLPDSQVIRDGWPKFLLRSSMADVMPQEICWRRSRHHLGWYFTRELRVPSGLPIGSPEQGNFALRYVIPDVLRSSRTGQVPSGGQSDHPIHSVEVLARWLDQNDRRPSAGV
jgi:asparagine synthase (glutamine-hydrolysing)